MRRITKAVITRGTVRPVVSLLFIVVVELSVLVVELIEMSMAVVGMAITKPYISTIIKSEVYAYLRREKVNQLQKRVKKMNQFQ